MEKTLGNTDADGTRKNVADVQIFGNGDMFQLLCKASSESQGWMKSTKAMEVDGGCMVQVTTQQRNPDGSYAVAEAVAFIPGVKVVLDMESGVLVGRHLESVHHATTSYDSLLDRFTYQPPTPAKVLSYNDIRAAEFACISEVRDALLSGNSSVYDSIKDATYSFAKTIEDLCLPCKSVDAAIDRIALARMVANDAAKECCQRSKRTRHLLQEARMLATESVAFAK